jgi:hypothetical protein
MPVFRILASGGMDPARGMAKVYWTARRKESAEMCYTDLRLAKAIMNERIEEAEQLVRSHDLLEQGAFGPLRWLSWQGCRLLRQMGHRLMTLGERLERLGTLQPSL